MASLAPACLLVERRKRRRREHRHAASGIKRWRRRPRLGLPAPSPSLLRRQCSQPPRQCLDAGAAAPSPHPRRRALPAPAAAAAGCAGAQVASSARRSAGLHAPAGGGGCPSRPSCQPRRLCPGGSAGWRSHRQQPAPRPVQLATRRRAVPAAAGGGAWIGRWRTCSGASSRCGCPHSLPLPLKPHTLYSWAICGRWPPASPASHLPPTPASPAARQAFSADPSQRQLVFPRSFSARDRWQVGPLLPVLPALPAGLPCLVL